MKVSPLFMCKGEGCPRSGKCFRSGQEPDEKYWTKAEPAERQLWLETPPYRDGNCSWFMVTEGKRERRIEAAA